MSRFWGGADDDDDDKSDDYSQSDSEDDEQDNQGQQAKPSRFMKGGDDDDSDDDDDKRIVRGEKEKRTDQFKEIIIATRKSLKSNDWPKVLTDIDKLIKQIERSKGAIAKHGNPPFVARILLEIESAQKRAEGTKEDRKKISKLNAKALSSIKQKISKLISTYKTEIEAIQKAEAAKAAAAEAGDDKDTADDDDDDDEDAEWQWGVVEAKTSTVVQDAPKSDENWSREIVTQKLRELIAQRGKKSLDRFEQIRKLLELLSHADGVDQELAIWFNIIAAIFDTTTANTQMSRHYWTQAYRSLCTVVAILNDNKDLVLREATSDITDVNVDLNVVTVVGSLVGLLTRLDDELTQSFQIVDPHSEQYILRLRDETKLVRLIERVQEYYERHNDNVIIAQVAAIRMAHLYSKREWVHKSLYDAEQYAIAHPEENAEPEKIDVADLRPTKAIIVDSDDEADDQEEDDSPEIVLIDVAEYKPIIVPARELPSRPLNYPYIDSRTLLKSLATIVFNYGDDRSKTRAILYLIFHHGLHDRFFEARDLLLMSHLQDNIHQVDVPTQILYNRALVQTGLCAFRVGLILDAHNSLSEICSGGKIKELLAQGTNRHIDRSPEQERIEKSRQIPYHMHINLDLVECAHFISAMLLEVPNMAANAYDPKRKVISRAFRKFLDFCDRQTFSGPPDNNTRESVIAAARALSTGNWRVAADYLLALRVWRFVPDHEEIKEMLVKKLKEEGLRTYLFAYGAYYSSFSLDELSETFNLPKSAIHSIVSKMMINDELRGSWDHPTSSIVMHNVEPSRLQALALQYTEKLAAVVESNERVLDVKLGGYTGKYDTRLTKESYSRGSDLRGSNTSSSSNNNNTSNNNRRYQRNDGNKRNDNRGGDRNDSDRRRTGGGNQRSNNRSSHKGQR